MGTGPGGPRQGWEGSGQGACTPAGGATEELVGRSARMSLLSLRALTLRPVPTTAPWKGGCRGPVGSAGCFARMAATLSFEGCPALPSAQSVGPSPGTWPALSLGRALPTLRRGRVDATLPGPGPTPRTSAPGEAARRSLFVWQIEQLSFREVNRHTQSHTARTPP